MSEIVLGVVGLTIRYGGVVAVVDVDLEIRAGEMVGLIGPNGAGKTSTIDAISGFADHSGRVVFGDQDLSGAAPHARARAGLARTWQSGELFDDLTVRQNCEVAASNLGVTHTLRDLVRPRRRENSSSVDAALEALDLADVGGEYPSSLPLGRQKLVGVARALAAAPDVLLLDEPAAGLDSGESLELGSTIRGLVDSGGPSVLLVDHDTALVFEVCDRVYVLDFGAVIASGTPAEVRSDPAVIAAYLGVGEE